MLGCARAFHKQYTGKHLLIAGRTTCKRPYDGDKLTSDSALRILMYEFPQKVILFGTQIRYIHQKCLTENLPIVTL